MPGHTPADDIPTALTIAGSDSGGGAGVQADLRTFHAFGVFGTSVITAVTAQNTLGVQAWEPMSRALVGQQLGSVFDDLPPRAFKTGMLGSADVVDAVARMIEHRRQLHYVLDPVMQSTSGTLLLADEAEQLMSERLLPLAELVTPNLHEAEVLAGRDILTEGDMEEAGRDLLEHGVRAVLVTGGHLPGDDLVDVLVTADGTRHWRHERLQTRPVHGTGCVLSAAIVAGLALGRDLPMAVGHAITYVQDGLKGASARGAGSLLLNPFAAPPGG